MSEPNKPQPRSEQEADPPAGQSGEPKLTPAQEWGERLDDGKDIARGGKEFGKVPGAEPAR